MATITTGRTTADAEVVNIWSAYYSYLPVGIPFPGSDESSWFEYVEASGATRRCFRVIAYNSAGDGPSSPEACGSPP